METIIVLWFITITAAISTSSNECELVQYLSIGKSGIVQCHFEDYDAITWYDPQEEESILLYKQGTKSGDGYMRGEYDVYPNGSLLIQNVSLKHDAMFSVIKVISVIQAITVQYDIRIKTVVMPHVSHPVIDMCPNGQTFCSITVVSDGLLNCVINGSRPPVKLSWTSTELEIDETLQPSYMCVTYDNITYMSRSTVQYSLSNLSFLNTFICKADNTPRSVIMETESVILIDKIINYGDFFVPTAIHVKVNSTMKLQCSNSTLKEAIVWKQLLDAKEDWSTVLFANLSRNSLKVSHQSEFDIDTDGTLSLTSIHIDQEGLYICLFNGARREDMVLYDVDTYVHPHPAYPVVGGCNPEQRCVLHVNDGDYLNCSVFSIRPEVQLEWMAIHEDITSVSFEDSRLSVTQRKGVFDVNLSGKISYSKSHGNNITVTCRVTQSKEHNFQLSTTIDLLFGNEDQKKAPSLFHLFVALVVVAAILAGIISISCIIPKKQQQSQTAPEADDEEEIPMIAHVDKTIQTAIEQIKEKEFFTLLKTKYQILCESLRPIPYIKDRMYCVDKLFIESDLEYLYQSDSPAEKENWRPLESYHDLFSEEMTSSNRTILEGEPGYGKSTISLQMVYDWCYSKEQSALGQIKILIYLRLRQLRGVTSIHDAIRRFILPFDSNLSVEDVKSVLEHCSSVLILLDGYDEYTDQDDTETDIYKIISMDMFQQSKVILTTRSSCLPKYRTRRTNRVRLNGFNDYCREKYIRKAIVGDDKVAVENIKLKLQNNPVLSDVCEVPLFFAMFAHITHENKGLQECKSVTSFFRYIVACLHSHMRNKMDDRNVQVFTLEEKEHTKLDEAAFKLLNGKHKNLMWEKKALCSEIGIELYNQYVKVGILMEEEKLDLSQRLDNIETVIEVRFFHNLFCEWYAAHYLAKAISTKAMKASAVVRSIDPYSLQYLYRFACGIDKDAEGDIVKYLQKTTDGQKFAILCLLEQDEEADTTTQSVKELVSMKITINKSDNRLLQRSTLQILEFATKKEFPIHCLCLNESLRGVDVDDIVLQSGMRLSCHSTLERIEVKREKNLSEAEMLGLLSCIQNMHGLKELRFEECLLPLSISVDSIPNKVKDADVNVFWCRQGCRLNFQSGLWEVKDLKAIKERCQDTVQLSKKDDMLLQQATVHLLKNASHESIPISCVELLDFSPRVDLKTLDLVLDNDLSLPILTSLQDLRIVERNKTLLEEEFKTILGYALQCSSLKVLVFYVDTVPDVVPNVWIPTTFVSDHVKVLYVRERKINKLNFKTGKWEDTYGQYFEHLDRLQMVE